MKLKQNSLAGVVQAGEDNLSSDRGQADQHTAHNQLCLEECDSKLEAEASCRESCRQTKWWNSISYCTGKNPASFSELIYRHKLNALQQENPMDTHRHLTDGHHRQAFIDRSLSEIQVDAAKVKSQAVLAIFRLKRRAKQGLINTSSATICATVSRGLIHGLCPAILPLQGSLYPHLAQDDRPRDKLMQVTSALAKLESPSMGAKAYRDQRIYELWTLSELMTDPYCCDEFMRQSALPAIVKFLAEDNSSGKLDVVK